MSEYKSIQVTIDGETYEGSYEITGGTVRVQYDDLEKTGHWRDEIMARQLLRELVRQSLSEKGGS